MGLAPVRALLCAGIILATFPGGASADYAVVVETTSAARRMHPVARTGRVRRALREVVGPGVRIVRRDRLRGEAETCLYTEPACRALLRRALGVDRVLRVHIGHARGPCVPMRRHGRRVGHRMLRVSALEVGWLDQPMRDERLPVGADDAELLTRLTALAREVVAPSP